MHLSLQFNAPPPHSHFFLVLKKNYHSHHFKTWTCHDKLDISTLSVGTMYFNNSPRQVIQNKKQIVLDIMVISQNVSTCKRFGSIYS